MPGKSKRDSLRTVGRMSMRNLKALRRWFQDMANDSDGLLRRSREVAKAAPTIAMQKQIDYHRNAASALRLVVWRIDNLIRHKGENVKEN